MVRALAKVRDEAEMVPVAVRPATETLPEKRPLPWISRAKRDEGDVVPTPTTPPAVAKYVKPDEVKAVVEAYGKTEAVLPVAVYLVAWSVEELVMPLTVSVPEAVRLAAVRFPEKRPLPWTPRVPAGEVVPMPTFEAKYALRVVVAPPETVRPPACVPLPIVEEAKAVRPALN
jgi:hypothetical protein